MAALGNGLADTDPRGPALPKLGATRRRGHWGTTVGMKVLMGATGVVLALRAQRDGNATHEEAEAPLGALRECRLSLRKAETLRRVASAMESGELTEEKLSRMGSKEAIRFLAELKGIGPWSASLVLLRGLGRLDVFPPGDVGVTRGLGSLMRLEHGPSLDRVIERFGDQRGYLYFCSLGSNLLGKGLIHAAPPPS